MDVKELSPFQLEHDQELEVFISVLEIYEISCLEMSGWT